MKIKLLTQIPIQKYKWFKGKGEQYAYKGIALTKAEQAVILASNEQTNAINQLIREHNKK